MALRLTPSGPPAPSGREANKDTLLIQKALKDRAKFAATPDERWVLIEDDIEYGKHLNRARSRAYAMNSSDGAWAGSKWRASVRKQQDGKFHLIGGYFGATVSQSDASA